MAHYKGAASEAGRAMQLMKKREIQLQDAELRKKKIEVEMKNINNIDSKFASHIGKPGRFPSSSSNNTNQTHFRRRRDAVESQHRWIGDSRRDEGETGNDCAGT